MTATRRPPPPPALITNIANIPDATNRTLRMARPTAATRLLLKISQSASAALVLVTPVSTPSKTSGNCKIEAPTDNDNEDTKRDEQCGDNEERYCRSFDNLECLFPCRDCSEPHRFAFFRQPRFSRWHGWWTHRERWWRYPGLTNKLRKCTRRLPVLKPFAPNKCVDRKSIFFKPSPDLLG